jgi:hypothetical protein
MTEIQQIFAASSKLSSCFTCSSTDFAVTRYPAGLSALSEHYLAESLRSVEGFTLSGSAGIMV